MTPLEQLTELIGSFGARYSQRGIIDRLAKHLYDHGTRVQRWIPAAERPPENNTEVLTRLAYGGQAVMKYMNNHFYNTNNVPMADGVVTHWMPLPDEPKEV